MNAKGIGADGRYNDSLRAVIRSSDDPRLKFLLNLGHMADKMKKSGKNRVRELTTDTAHTILAIHLLNWEIIYWVLVMFM